MPSNPHSPDPRTAAAGAPVAAALSLVWSRDGRSAPDPGAPGDLLLRAEDELSRTFRGRGADGRPIAVEVRKDMVDPAALPASWGKVTNPALDALWRRRVATAGTAGAEWPTLVLCREKGVTFRPPSPASGAPEGLEECRDDDLLRAAGLPAWSESVSRWLHDPSIRRQDPNWRIWTVATPPRGAPAEVGGWERFAKDLGRVVDLAAAQGTSSALRDRFPCIGCPEVPRCYGRTAPGAPSAGIAPQAPSRLVPVAMYRAGVIIHREDVLDFGEHTDLLGGARWAQFRARHAAAWKHAGTRVVRESLEAEIASRAGVVSPLAAFRAKLRLYEGAVEAALAHARAAKAPHLAISPTTVVSHSLRPRGDGRFDVGLRGAARCLAVDEGPTAPPGGPLWLPPPGAVAPYAHPDLRRAAEAVSTAPPDGPTVHEGGFRYGRTSPAKVRVRRVWDPGDGTPCEFELDLLGLAMTAGESEPTDRLRVTIDGDAWKGVTVWCRPDRERVVPDGFAVRAFPISLPSGNRLDLETASKGRPLFGTVAVFRGFGAFFDVHALGMLLARCLLENSTRSIDAVARDVLPALATFSGAAVGHGGKDRWEELTDVMENLARTAPFDAALADVNVCFDPREAKTSSDRVPPRLWAEALAIVAACTSSTRGAALCRSTRLEPTPQDLCRPYEELLGRVRSILTRLPDAAEPPPDERDTWMGPVPAAAKAKHGASHAPAAAPTAMSQTAATKSAAPPPVAAAPDRRDSRITELETALAAATARAERLTAEAASVQKKLAHAQKASVAPAAAAADPGPWRYLRDALSGVRDLPFKSPRPGDLSVELARALLVEGLGTMSALNQAVAELAGQDFAAEQRNLERQVRNALASAARGEPDAPAMLQGAIDAIGLMRSRLGTVVAMLVEAHGHASRDGTRKLVKMVAVAVGKELSLTKPQEARLDDLTQRMDGAVNELVAQLLEPAFQAFIRNALLHGGADARRKR